MGGAGRGQNFLVNREVAEKIVESFLPVPGKVLEIGPGRGILTDLLARHAKTNEIVAVEWDGRLAAALQDKYAGDPSLKIVCSDILRVNLEKEFPGETLHVIGNIPYYISGELIDWTISHYRGIAGGTFTMQKEFVEKLILRRKSPRALAFQLLFDSARLLEISPGSFSPPPRVKSSVFRFRRQADPAGSSLDPHEFYAFLKTCFSNRRKTLFNNLRDRYPKEMARQALAAFHIRPPARPEELTLPDFLNLFKVLKQ